ncbi:MAG: 16S rRNA (cytosine(967)-C(5))-methyltransferase RsmB [Candidatus Eisenbacteria bacterium]
MPRHKKSTARETAAFILAAVDSRGAFSDRLLTSHLAKTHLSQEDRNFVTYLVNGTLRWRGRLDWVLSRFLQTDLQELPIWIRNVLRMGAFQILFMERVPVSAATDESVKLARKRGHPGTAGLVNAVLRRLVREKDVLEYPDMDGEPVRAISVFYSHPEWMVERWLRRFGKERVIRICEANNSLDHLFVRANLMRAEPHELVRLFTERGSQAVVGTLNFSVIRVRGHLSPSTDAAFKDGLYTPQDEAESLVVRLLSPETGRLFLDACAGPGGKATQIGETTEDKRLVCCLEVYEARARQVRDSAERVGLRSLKVVAGDGRAIPFGVKFDRVLVDAPCSGLGVLGKRADARWRKKESALQVLSGLQQELLQSASALVEEKGILVYSVCSFEPEETAEVVSRFVEKNPGFETDDASSFVGGSFVNSDGAMQILPDELGTDGVFAVRMRRKVKRRQGSFAEPA